MATAARSYSDEIKLTAVPQVFALKFIAGKDVISKFPGGRVMFTLADSRKLFLNDEDANEFEHSMLEQGIGPTDFMSVSRVSHGRGGGFSIRVEKIDDEGSAIESQLEQSVAIARHGQNPSLRAKETTAPPQQERAAHSGYRGTLNNNQPNNPTPEPPAAAEGGTMGQLLAGALCASIDAYVLASEYAQSKGLALTFAAESIQASANTMLIQYWRDGGTR
jgi:hypothetical protein